MIHDIIDSAHLRMKKSIKSVQSDLAKLRTGRASPVLIEHLTVEYYGAMTPLNQVASISVQDARTLLVQPWESHLIPLIEKTILESNLGFNPQTSGEVIRIPLPLLTEERRRELVKLATVEGESGKVAIRNIRRDAIGEFKSLLKNKEISEDDAKRAENDIQKITDGCIQEIAQIVEHKEKEIMQV